MVNVAEIVRSKSLSSVFWIPLGYAFLGVFTYSLLVWAVWDHVSKDDIYVQYFEGAIMILVADYIIAVQARKRGFQPLWWLIAFGWIGLVVIFAMPVANEVGLSNNRYKQRRRNASIVGFLISAFFVFSWFYLFLNQSP